MAVLPIRIFGDPVLRERAREVADFDDALARLGEDMLDTLATAAGAAIAGNQVGVLKRLFAFDVDVDDGHHRGVYVNPEVLETSAEEAVDEEGCLSFPGLFFPTPRPLRARIRARDVHGDELERTGEGLMARMFLHEIDHLNGVLFIDHLARHDRKEAMRRIRAGELEHPPATTGGSGAPAV